MITLNLPKYQLKTKIENGKQLIFDDIRKKFLVLTPEEWVRQNFIKYLIHDKSFPASLMNVEGGLNLNGNRFRADLLIYNKQAEPLVLVEFKAPHVNITQDSFDQIARYNIIYKVPYLIVSNGLKHYFCKVDYEQMTYVFECEVPSFNAL